MQRKHKDGKNKCFVLLHCAFYVLNLLLNGSDNIKPFSVLSYVYIYLFMLCDFLFFFMKVPFNMSCSTLRTYSIPHSLLLYSVHVKWILICVQNVDKEYTWLYTLYIPVLRVDCCTFTRKCTLFVFYYRIQTL